MDRKTIIVLAACFALMFSWPLLVRKLWPPTPRPPGATNPQPVATAAAASNATTSTTNLETPAPLTSTSTAPPVFVQPGAPEESLTVTNENARYTFTSHGGGLKVIELLKYPETVTRKRAGADATNRLASLNSAEQPPVLAILGGEAVQGYGVFQLTRTASGVRAEKTLTNGLTLVKEFQISTNYLMAATVRFENRSTQSLALPPQQWVIGTATPMGPDDNGQAVGMMWYNGASTDEKNKMWFDNTSLLGCLGLAERQPRAEFRSGASNVVWATVHNQFFTLAAMPKDPAPQVVAYPVDLPRPASWQDHSRTRSAPAPKGFRAAFAYPAVTLAPGQTLERQFDLFAGPKEYRTLARIASRFNNNLDVVMGFGGFFGWFAKLLLLSMNGLHDLLRVGSVQLGYGWVIIFITFIIKLVFWPLTQASTRSMKRMQTLQPQMNALKEKYKDDAAKMNKKLMEFMKENKVNPMGGCLPMVIQLPIFFGFYRMIQSAIELRGERFLWVSDLSMPDTLFRIPGLDMPFNLLPLIMGATMLWQAQTTPPSPGMDPTQQKMMKYMPLIFLFMLYNFSAGLTLYWTVQNLLTIAQMKLTKTQAGPGGNAPATPSSALAPKRKK